MAVADENALMATPPTVPTLFGLPQTPAIRTAMLSAGAALIIAIMVGVWLWSQQPDYRVLLSNFNDRDGGAIVTALQQMNVPYKYSDGGNAILVPANQVYDTRLKLATQGLPKGGNVGFELMENQKLGVSQFLEQVNFQRALEGELARSVQAISAVQAARVHLAIPKSSVFVREQQKPTASVLLNLYPGRILDQPQVSAIVHLVASSVPELSAKDITIVDQNGNLLSDTSKSGSNNLDPSQLKYVQELQDNLVKRIESIVAPIVGASNVKAQATADVDFSSTEQAAESYRPNQSADSAAIRSQQTSESYNKTANASGIPGALTNQPPVPSTAPISTSGAALSQATAASNAGLTQKDATVNYELDKTIRYTQQQMGGLKRLSVAVVLNYKREVDKNGKASSRPLTDEEKNQITDLVRETMGFSKERGDSLNVVNSPFAATESEPIVEEPMWKQVGSSLLTKETLKYLAAAAVLLYLFFAYLRPMLYKIMGKEEKDRAAKLEKEKQLQLEKEAEEQARREEEEAAIVELSTEATEATAKPLSAYELDLEMAKEMAKTNPKIVANVIKAWMSGNE
jgi:flagellar M-ring protein FliF